MDANKKSARYDRIYNQLKELLKKSNDSNARMCSVASVLHHKMTNFFWTGFYLLTDDDKLIVRTYQGPVACMELSKNQGVCWESINQEKIIVVKDVQEFPGHIACDSRSKSEIVIPVKANDGTVIGVLDVDSDKLNAFDDIDTLWLEKIVLLINISK